MNDERKNAAKRHCLELGMSEHEISALLDREPADRTSKLIRLFNGTSDEARKRKILALIYYAGDEEVTANFYADLLPRPDLKPAMKFWIAVWGKMGKFNNHLRLRRILDAHLQGESPARVLLRALFPNGRTCSGRELRLPPRRIKTPQRELINSLKKPAKILAFERPVDN